MSYSRLDFHIRRQALEGFNRLHRTWQFRQFWMRMLGRKPAELQSLGQIEETHHVVARTRLGVQSVPLAQIRGSLGRTQDFDAAFRPRTVHTAERWIQVAMANAREIELPAVQLVHVQERYFVVDGHHRISVARHVGRLDIDANVEGWQVEPKPQAGGAYPHKPPSLRTGSEPDASWLDAWRRMARRTLSSAVRALVPALGSRTAAGIR